MKSLLLAVSLLLIYPTESFASKLGLKTFRELPVAYSTVLNVPTVSNPALLAVIKRVASRLPQKGDVAEMSSPMLLAVYELAGAFCGNFVDTEIAKPAAERLIFKDVDFKAGSKQFSMGLQRHLISEMAETFWFRAPLENEQQELETFFGQLVSTSGASSSESKNISFLLCTYFGTSLQFLVD